MFPIGRAMLKHRHARRLPAAMVVGTEVAPERVVEWSDFALEFSAMKIGRHDVLPAAFFVEFQNFVVEVSGVVEAQNTARRFKGLDHRSGVVDQTRQPMRLERGAAIERLRGDDGADHERCPLQSFGAVAIDFGRVEASPAHFELSGVAESDHVAVEVDDLVRKRFEATCRHRAGEGVERLAIARARRLGLLGNDSPMLPPALEASEQIDRRMRASRLAVSVVELARLEARHFSQRVVNRAFRRESRVESKKFGVEIIEA